VRAQRTQIVSSASCERSFDPTVVGEAMLPPGFEPLARDATDVVAAKIVNFDDHWTREWTRDDAHLT